MRPGTYYDGLTHLASLDHRTFKPVFIEIGTYRGFSALALAKGCPDATIFTIDINMLPEALRRFEEARLKRGYDIIPIVGDSTSIGNALIRVGALSNGIHLLFIDGDHSFQQVLADFNRFFLMLRPGGILAMHDTDMYGPRLVWDLASGLLQGVDSYETMKFGIKLDRSER